MARGSALSGTNAVGGGPGQAPVDYDEPRIFVYDNYPGGIGLSEPLFAMRRETWSAKTRDLIASRARASRAARRASGRWARSARWPRRVALEILARDGSLDDFRN